MKVSRSLDCGLNFLTNDRSANTQENDKTALSEYVTGNPLGPTKVIEGVCSNACPFFCAIKEIPAGWGGCIRVATREMKQNYRNASHIIQSG